MLSITYTGGLLAVDPSKLNESTEMTAPAPIEDHPSSVIASLWSNAVAEGYVVVPDGLRVDCTSSDDDVESCVVLVAYADDLRAGITSGAMSTDNFSSDEGDDEPAAIERSVSAMVEAVNLMLESVREPVVHRSQIRRVLDAYEPYCPCGWVGSHRILAPAAQAAANEHVHEASGTTPSKPKTEKQVSLHGVTAIITRSAGADGAPLVMIDTDGEVVADGPRGPLMRVLLNDEPVYAGVAYEPSEPTDLEIYNRYGVEGGIAYDASDNRTEDDV